MEQPKYIYESLTKRHPEFSELEVLAKLDLSRATPLEISDTAIKMCAYLCRIGVIEADAKVYLEQVKQKRKKDYLNYMVEAEGTKSEREAVSNKKIKGMEEAEIIAKYVYERVRNFREDYKSFALALMNRNRVLENEEKMMNKQT